MSRFILIRLFPSISALFLLTAIAVSAQTTRPRRTGKQAQKTTTSSQAPASDPLLKPEPVPTTATRKTSPNDPLLTVQPVQPVANTVANTANTTNTAAPADTQHAYALLEQKQFAAAAKEAKNLAEQHPNDPEAWKIAGFAELNLKQYADATKDLEKAVSLQRQAKQPDPNTESALGQAYVLSEKYQEALPLLVAATDRAGGQPDATMIYYRGISEY
jgi:tetratricopeptide (TPR) repeat protein